MSLLGQKARSSRIRQLTAVASLALLLSGSIHPQAAARPEKRTLEIVYRSPAVAADNNFGYCSAEHQLGCVVTRPKAGETSVTLEVVDAVSPTVAGYLYYQRPNGSVVSHPFCGEAEKPIRVRPRWRFVVSILAVPCEDGTPATATTGVIRLTFSKAA